MHFAHFIENRKLLTWAVSLAVMLGILIIAFVLWYGKSQGQFDLNELYGILDSVASEARTDQALWTTIEIVR